MGYDGRDRRQGSLWRKTAVYSQLRARLKEICKTHRSGGNGNLEGVAVGGITREYKTLSDGRRRGGGIGDG